MKQANGLFLLFSLCLLVSGCATLFKGTYQEVSFNSDPQRADVFVDGKRMGQTPMALNLQTKKDYTIEFRAMGFEPQTYVITNKIGAGWIILDAFTGPIGIIVDAVTGAWYSLSTQNVNMILRKQLPTSF